MPSRHQEELHEQHPLKTAVARKTSHLAEALLEDTSNHELGTAPEVLPRGDPSLGKDLAEANLADFRMMNTLIPRIARSS